MPGGYVNTATTKRNLLWFVVVAVLLSFHACVRLAWMAEKDEEDRLQPTPEHHSNVGRTNSSFRDGGRRR